MYTGFFGLSVLVIPLFLAVLSIYLLCLCCKRGKSSSEREDRWEASHPNSGEGDHPSSGAGAGASSGGGGGAGDHPYGSNTLFAPLPPTTEYEWGQKEENHQIQLPPPYDSLIPPSYSSWPADQQPPGPLPHQSFSAIPWRNPPTMFSISSSNSSLPPAD